MEWRTDGAGVHASSDGAAALHMHTQGSAKRRRVTEEPDDVHGEEGTVVTMN